MSDIFREIDEELRRDNLLALWSRYGRYVIAFVVLALLVAGGIAAWRAHEQTERQAQSARFASALSLLRSGKTADAAVVFATIAREGGGYAQLAAFEQADLVAKSGDHAKAAAAYRRIADDSRFSSSFRGLASLLAAMQEDANADPKSTIVRLAPLIVDDNPWQPTALELTAAAQLQLGDNKAALATYRRLADDLAAPRDLRARAAEMAAALAP